MKPDSFFLTLFTTFAVATRRCVALPADTADHVLPTVTKTIYHTMVRRRSVNVPGSNNTSDSLNAVAAAPPYDCPRGDNDSILMARESNDGLFRPSRKLAELSHLQIKFGDKEGLIAVSLPNDIAKSFCDSVVAVTKEDSEPTSVKLKIDVNDSTAKIPVSVQKAKEFCQKLDNTDDANDGVSSAKENEASATTDTTESEKPMTTSNTEDEPVATSQKAKAKTSEKAKSTSSEPEENPASSAEATEEPTVAKTTTAKTTPAATSNTESKEASEPATTAQSEAAVESSTAKKTTKTTTKAAPANTSKAESESDDATSAKKSELATTAAGSTDAAAKSTSEAKASDIMTTKKKQTPTDDEATPSLDAAEPALTSLSDESTGGEETTKAAEEIASAEGSVDAKKNVPSSTAAATTGASPSKSSEALFDGTSTAPPLESVTVLSPSAKPSVGQDEAAVEARGTPLEASTTMYTVASSSNTGAALNVPPLQNSASPQLTSWKWRKNTANTLTQLVRRNNEDSEDKDSDEEDQEEKHGDKPGDKGADKPTDKSKDVNSMKVSRTALKGTKAPAGAGNQEKKPPGSKVPDSTPEGDKIQDEDSDSDSDEEEAKPPPAAEKPPEAAKPLTSADPAEDAPKDKSKENPDEDKDKGKETKANDPLPPPNDTEKPKDTKTSDPPPKAKETSSSSKKKKEDTKTIHLSLKSKETSTTEKDKETKVPQNALPKPTTPPNANLTTTNNTTASLLTHLLPPPTGTAPALLSWHISCSTTIFTSSPTNDPKKTDVPHLVTSTMGCWKPVEKTSMEYEQLSVAWAKIHDPGMRWSVYFLWGIAAVFVVFGV